MDEYNSFIPVQEDAKQRFGSQNRQEIPRSVSWIVYMSLLAGIILCLTGCKDFPIAKNKQPSAGPSPEAIAMQNQLQQMNERFAALERANAQINTQLAQTHQSLVLEQQTNQTGRQQYAALQESNKRLQEENQGLQTKIAQMTQQAQGMLALGTIQPSTAIVPNTSTNYAVNLSDLPGVQTRREGLDYRVSIPSVQLFSDDRVSLTEKGKATLITVMQRLNDTFKNPSLRIEAHVGQIQEVSASDPTLNTPQGLTARQAINVSEALKAANIPLPDKTSVSGCGNSLSQDVSSSDGVEQTNQHIDFVITP